MRFVDHDELGILKQQHFLEQNGWFIRHLAVVVEALVRLVGLVTKNGLAQFVDHLTTGHTHLPHGAGTGWEALG